MNREMIPHAEQYVKKRRRKSLLQKIVTVLACLVVFCTTYALILPAITTKTDTFCGVDEHVHTGDCYVQVSVEDPLLVCNAQALGIHSHTAECRDAEGMLICGQADFVAHAHDAKCYDAQGALVCSLEERSTHVHTAECYAELTAQPTEAVTLHAHSEGCYAPVRGELTCELSENAGHTHEAACYAQGEALLCTSEEEGHVHEAACYEQILQCELPEAEAHTHDEECYAWTQELICGMEEQTEEQTEPSTDVFHTPTAHELICGQVEASVHAHGESCFEAAEQALTCQLPEDENHTHTELCYGVWELKCEVEEHTHNIACYADPSADVESSDIWEGTLSGIELSGDWQQDVLAIAKSQLGYAESTKNYIITETGSQKGYSRYGAWFGDSYGDWCAMFTSFCMHYAGVEGIPLNAACTPWIRELKEMNLYRESGAGYTPQPGDLIFYDWEKDGLSDHVGFVSELVAATENEPEKLIALEGNSSDRVQYVTYAADDTRIAGYGLLSRNRLQRKLCGMDEHSHEEACYDEAGSLICTLSEHTHSDSCNEYKVVYNDNQIRAFVTIKGVEQLPADLTLTVTPVTQEENQATFDSMQVALSEKMATRTQYVGAASFYSLQLHSEGQPYELPEEARVSVEMSFADPVFTAEELAEAAGVHTYVITPNLEAQPEQTEPAETQPLETVDTPITSGGELSTGGEFPKKNGIGSVTNAVATEPGNVLAVTNETADETLSDAEETTYEQPAESYLAEQPEAEVYENAEEGITGVSFRAGEIATVALALTRETVAGTFWERVYSTNDIVSGGTYIIVSAQGNMAINGNNSSNSTAVTLTTVKANEEYYVISGSDNTNLRWTITKNGNSYTIRNQGTSNYIYMDTVWSLFNGTKEYMIYSSSKNLTLTYAPTEKCWYIKNGTYYLRNNGSGSFYRSEGEDSAQYYGSANYYYNADMMIFKLSDVTELSVPEDVTGDLGNSGNENEAPERPDYPDFIQPSGSKKGETALTGKDADNAAITIKGKYYSDPATSDIEKEYRKDSFAETELNDGKVLTDKSVIYMGDDYGAFESYDPNTFGVTLSTMGQEYKVPYQEVVKTPVDVVFVLDVSGSMSHSGQAGSSDKRMKDMVPAVNAAIAEIMDEHPENRIGLAIYSGGAWELLPLDRYTATNGEYFVHTDGSESHYHQGTSQNLSNRLYLLGGPTLKNDEGVSFANVGSDAVQGLGTHTQAGIAMGRKIFHDIGDDTTYTTTVGFGEYEREYTVQRQPVFILLSDGEPTYSTNNYMDPLNGPHYGDGNGGPNNAKGIHGYYTVLTANYCKRMVSIHYEKPALFFTVGMGINNKEQGDGPQIEGSDTGDNYKRAVLNPTVDNVQNLTSIVNPTTTTTQFKNLINGQFTASTVDVTCTWPETMLGIPHTIVPVLQGNPYANDYSYADNAYFGKITEQELEQIFSDILQSSIKTSPYGFILYRNSAIDLKDNIGKGMEIKGTPVLRYNGINYTDPTVTVNGPVTTYTYHGTYVDPYIPDRECDISQITVRVVKNDDGTQSVIMYVPDAVLPTYTPETIGLEYYYEALPVRLIYQVGLTEESEQKVLDLQKTGGELTFYANKWSSPEEYAISTLIPSAYNPFYQDVDPDDDIYPAYHAHHEDKTDNTTGSLEFSVDCNQYIDSEVDHMMRVVHTLGNNGKLVFGVESTEIPVEKSWEEVNPDIMNPVTVELYKVAETVTEEGITNRTGTLVSSLTLSTENEWKDKFTGVSIPGEDWYYVVVEKPLSGYQAFYDGESVSFSVDNGTPITGVKVDFAEPKNGLVKITNAPAAELPSTGGEGTILYTLSGCVLIAAAGGTLMYTRHGRRRKGDKAHS